MQTHTIAPANWRNTLDSLSRIADGSSGSLEILRDDMGAQYEVEEVPLRGISCDSSGIELHFALRDGRHFVHRIEHPRSVKLEEQDDGTIAALEIDSDDDPRAVLRFHAPLASRLLPRGEA